MIIVALLKSRCSFCYVGKTKRELRTRFTDQKQYYDKRWEIPYRHFDRTGHDIWGFKAENMSNPLKRGEDRDQLSQREAFGAIS